MAECASGSHIFSLFLLDEGASIKVESTIVLFSVLDLIVKECLQYIRKFAPECRFQSADYGIYLYYPRLGSDCWIQRRRTPKKPGCRLLRYREILRLDSQGSTQRQIAASVGSSRRTRKNRRHAHAFVGGVQREMHQRWEASVYDDAVRRQVPPLGAHHKSDDADPSQVRRRYGRRLGRTEAAGL